MLNVSTTRMKGFLGRKRMNPIQRGRENHPINQDAVQLKSDLLNIKQFFYNGFNIRALMEATFIFFPFIILPVNRSV